MAVAIVLTDKERILLLEQRVENLEERLAKTEDQLAIYQASTITFNHKLSEVGQNITDLHKAIIGDSYGNPGFVKRMEGLEKFQDWFEQKKWWSLGAMAVITAAITAVIFVMDRIKEVIK